MTAVSVVAKARTCPCRLLMASSSMPAPSALEVAARARELLHYEPEEGVFTWKVARRHVVKAGDVAGSLNDKGYRYIGIDGKTYRAHRLAWLLVHGVWPEMELDHINGDRDDNRISNLRDVSTGQNARNRTRCRVGTSSGLLGSSLLPSGNWQARITAHGESAYLGVHATKEAAHAAYLKAKAELHEGSTL